YCFIHHQLYSIFSEFFVRLPTFSTLSSYSFFFFNDPPTTEIYTLSLHDALPIYFDAVLVLQDAAYPHRCGHLVLDRADALAREIDRKSTRLNSSHSQISYAVFCLKKKKKKKMINENKIRSKYNILYKIHLRTTFI